jgi:hypothetical protein
MPSVGKSGRVSFFFSSFVLWYLLCGLAGSPQERRDSSFARGPWLVPFRGVCLLRYGYITATKRMVAVIVSERQKITFQKKGLFMLLDALLIAHRCTCALLTLLWASHEITHANSLANESCSA